MPYRACYQVDEGITITHPLVINGGTFKDLTDSGTGKHQGYHPIIEVREGDDVTLENLTVEGEHTSKGFTGGKVGEAGIKVLPSSDVTITNVIAEYTFGDGLELVADSGGIGASADRSKRRIATSPSTGSSRICPVGPGSRRPRSSTRCSPMSIST